MCHSCESDYGYHVGQKCPTCGDVIQAPTGPHTSDISVTMVIKYSGNITEPNLEGVTYSSPNYSGFSESDKTLINKLLEGTGLPRL